MATLPGQLTIEDLKTVLQRRFNNADVQYDSCEFNSQTEDLNGFLGDHYMLKISYTLDGIKHTENFFVKTKPTLTQTQIDMVDSLDVFTKEIFVYNTLVEEYRRRGYNVDFAAKMYLCVPGVTMVLEDLKCRGFSLSGRTKFYDLPQMKVCLKSLAQFHAASFLYEEDKSRELGMVYRLDEQYARELKECVFTFGDAPNLASKFYETSVDSLPGLIDLFEEEDQWKKDFRQQFATLNLAEVFRPALKSRKALGHGDLWSNNMMFRWENGVPVECCLLDYQILRYLQPTLDVLLAIYNSTGIAVRKDHLRTFLDHYYECLREEIEGRGYRLEEIYSRATYEHDLESMLLPAVLLVTCNHAVQYLNMDMVKKTMTDNEDGMKDLLFDDKNATVREAFKHDPQFRRVVQGDLYEVHRALAERKIKNNAV